MATAKTKKTSKKTAKKAPKAAAKVAKKAAKKTAPGPKAKAKKKSARAAAPAPAGSPFRAATAAEMMTADPKTIRREATVAEAAAFLDDKGISAAAVIDDAGRPIGVLSRTDIVRHGTKSARAGQAKYDFYEHDGLTGLVEAPAAEGGEGEGGVGGPATVGHIMTPIVRSVSPEASAAEVVRGLVEHQVHRLFVIDKAGVLVGVISALDVLKSLNA